MNSARFYAWQPRTHFCLTCGYSEINILFYKKTNPVYAIARVLIYEKSRAFVFPDKTDFDEFMKQKELITVIPLPNSNKLKDNHDERILNQVYRIW